MSCGKEICSDKWGVLEYHRLGSMSASPPTPNLFFVRTGFVSRKLMQKPEILERTFRLLAFLLTLFTWNVAFKPRKTAASIPFGYPPIKDRAFWKNCLAIGGPGRPIWMIGE